MPKYPTSGYTSKNGAGSQKFQRRTTKRTFVQKNTYYTTVNAAQLVAGTSHSTVAFTGNVDFGGRRTSPRMAKNKTTVSKREAVSSTSQNPPVKKRKTTTMAGQVIDAQAVKFALKEYAESGTAGRENNATRSIIGHLVTAEANATQGEMAPALTALKKASRSISAFNIDPAFVSGLAYELVENVTSPIRAVILYFCASGLVKSGNPGISGHILGMGKAFDLTEHDARGYMNLVKKFGLPLMIEMLGLLSASGVVERAFALNWVAFSCNKVGEYEKAVEYARNGVGEVDENFGRNGAPRHQVYCRLLLTLGEAFHNLGHFIEAATSLKRASLTAGMAKDFKSTQKRIVSAKIAQCRQINNQALRG